MGFNCLQVVSAGKDEYVIENLKSTGFGILERCGGLPVAIKAIAGILIHKEINEIEWGKVLTSPSWSVEGMPDEINHAIYLSYDDLAPCLKQCLLYFSLFPTHSCPSRNSIIQLWISEGFVNGNSNEREELGKEYYNELMMRNLIQKGLSTDWIMHDVVRSFCQHVASDEALASHVGRLKDTDLDSKRYRWLCVQNISNCRNFQKQDSVRTLHLYGRDNGNLNLSDLCSTFSSLRVLQVTKVQHIISIDSLCQLKNLRFLIFDYTQISRLPDDIGKMKFLEYIGISNCEEIEELPGSIIKLERLRCVNLFRTSINSIPRGFSELTNLRTVFSFPAQMCSTSSKEEWCSLQELGPLSDLRMLGLVGLLNVSSGSLAAKAKLGTKKHLTILDLTCSDGLLREEGDISMDEQRRIEEVFDELCPPHSLEELFIRGYSGQRLPRWMASKASVKFDKLMNVWLEGLACCTRLPDGLFHFPCLKILTIKSAPAIKRIEQHNGYHNHSQAAVPFPKLEFLEFTGMLEWEEWVWEDTTQAMPLLEKLVLERCKLRELPLGLASHARALKFLKFHKVQNLKSIQNLSSVVDLDVQDNPSMESITSLPKLQILNIVYCPKLTVLEGIPALQTLFLTDYIMKTLPGYLQDVKPRSLVLDCTLPLLSDISMGPSSSEWDKISHIQQIHGYAPEMHIRRRWYVSYKASKLDTNIACSSKSRGIIDGLLMDNEKRSKELQDLLANQARHAKEMRMVKLLCAFLTIVVGFVCILAYRYGFLL
uniref:NB-ARC domain-containing protein n=1 Tax=Oryza brachyantha TaxID=4533 RepID=J3NC40_ORYBR